MQDPFKVMKALLLDESILTEYKSRWRSIIKSNLKYEKNTIYVNFPLQNDVEYDDQIGQDLFVYAGFMKPGKQTLIIKDNELNCNFSKSFAVDLREHELIIGKINIIVNLYYHYRNFGQQP